MPATGTIAALNNRLGGASRRLARAVPFRPMHLELEAPVVSFSFDDFPVSAGTDGARILEDAGMRGTFYYAGGLAGRLENGQLIADGPLVSDLALRGHEIGAHTHGHLHVQRASSATLIADIAQNRREITTLTGGTPPASFAYPFGVLSLRSKLTLMHSFAGLRGIQNGVNSGLIDLAHLRSQELYDSSSDAKALGAVLDEAERSRGWLIFYTHDVTADPSSIGCSPRYFAEIVDLVRRRGFRVETVAQTLCRIGARHHQQTPRNAVNFTD